MTAMELFTTVRQSGAILTPIVDHVRIDVPKGVLTPALRQQLTLHKAELLELVEAFEERSAIAEYCGGLPRAAAEALAWQWLRDHETLEVSYGW